MLSAPVITLSNTLKEKKHRSLTKRAQEDKKEENKKWGVIEYLKFLAGVLSQLPIVSKIGDILNAILEGDIAFVCNKDIWDGSYFDAAGKLLPTFAGDKIANSELTKKWIEDTAAQVGDTVKEVTTDLVTDEIFDTKDKKEKEEADKEKKDETKAVQDVVGSKSNDALITGENDKIQLNFKTGGLYSVCWDLKKYIKEPKSEAYIKDCKAMFEQYRKDLDTKGDKAELPHQLVGTRCAIGKKEFKSCYTSRFARSYQVYRDSINTPTKQISYSRFFGSISYTNIDEKDKPAIEQRIKNIKLESNKACADKMVNTYSDLETLKDLDDCKEVNASTESLDDAKMTEAKSGWSTVTKVALYILKQLVRCGLRLGISALFEVLKTAVTTLITHILNWLTVGAFTAIKAAFYVFKLAWNIYKGMTEKELKDRAGRWGNALGIGIRLILIAAGVARRRRVMKRKLLKKGLKKKI